MADSMGKAEDFATVIGSDAQFKGELSFQGGVRIDGKFEGSIASGGRVHVSKGGRLKAEVKAGSISLEGEIDGNISAEDRVEIKATGQMRGDVRAAKLVVVEGASFVGRCEVGAGAKAAAPAAKRSPDMQPVGAGSGGRK